MEPIEWAYENIGEITSKGQLNNMADFLAAKQLDLVVNLPMHNGGARRVSSFFTQGNIFDDSIQPFHFRVNFYWLNIFFCPAFHVVVTTCWLPAWNIFVLYSLQLSIQILIHVK